MSDHTNVTLAPNGCPLETHPVDPGRLFSKDGLNLDLPRIGWIGAGICTVISTAISLVLIWRHLQYYTKPNQQRYIVRMLLMVPIYAISSWFSFVYVREAVYFESIRILYEAFVIASFLILMLQYLGDSLEDQKRALRQHKKTERWFFPMCCLKYNPSRPHFLQFMKWGILQYVPLVVVATILTIVLQYYGWYCESSWNPKFGHAWILIINTTAVTVATYFLIMFYFTIREDLREYDPFYKFMAVKLVVFFSFWQMVLVEGLVYFGYIHATTYWSTTDISVGICAVLIDIEMVAFALMHVKAFSYKPYVPLIPNPAYVPQESQSAVDDKDGDNSTNGNDLDSVHAAPKSTGPSSYRRNSLRRNPSLSSLSSDDERKRKRKVKAEKAKKSKASEKSKEASEPKMILDFTQRTPIWKGLLDSFNPLDTLRELGYGFKYLYRWARGIPVDKDSRRLLDLEAAFGRLRPEVPFIPPKNKKDKDKKDKTKDKKKKKGNGSDSDDVGASDDTDDIDEDEDADAAIATGKKRDSEKADNGIEYHAGVGNSRSQDSLRNPRVQSKRVMVDVELGYGSNNVDTISMHTFRESHVVRKPVKAVSGTTANVGNNGGKKKSVEYLGKEAAARTENATLPDIKLDPIPKKAFLSGVYEDLPLASDQAASSTSSLDIPMPSAMPAAGNYRSTPFNDDNRQTLEHALEQDPFMSVGRQGYVTRPFYQDHLYSAGTSSLRPGGAGKAVGLTQLSNRNFDTKTVSHRQDFMDTTTEPSESGSLIGNRDPRFDDHYRSQHMASRDMSVQSSVVTGIYHNREGSRSDPELGRYGLDHEHYLEQMRYLAEEEEAVRHQLQQRELDVNQEGSVFHRHIDASKDAPEVADLLKQKPQAHSQEETLQPTSRYPYDLVGQDPVVADYSQVRLQQELQQPQHLQQQRVHYQQPPSIRKQPLPARRRNSLDSLGSSSSGGYCVAYRYERPYDPVPVEVPFRPQYALRQQHQQQKQQQQQQSQQAYQSSYRYPMPLSQPSPPAQLYRFPDEREYLPSPPAQSRGRGGHYYSGRGGGPPAAVSVAMRSAQYTHPYEEYHHTGQPYYPQPQHSYAQQERMESSRGGADGPRYRSPPPLTARAPVAGRQGPGDRGERGWDRGGREAGDRDREKTGFRRDQSPGPRAEHLFPASRYAAPFLRDYEYQQRETRRRMTQSPPPQSPHPILRHDSPGAGDPRSHDSSSRCVSYRDEREREGGSSALTTGQRDSGNRQRSPPQVVQAALHSRGPVSQDYANTLGAPRAAVAGVDFKPQMKPGPAAEADRSKGNEDDGPYEEAVLWTRPPPIH
ncbi:hypothetical protein BG004_006673 [Podila humilis]|nr:hypothetical protein BG004_006673 [Podila humilis]